MQTSSDAWRPPPLAFTYTKDQAEVKVVASKIKSKNPMQDKATQESSACLNSQPAAARRR